jgi:hypothetical protein
MMRTFLENLVVQKIKELGRAEAAEFFEVTDLRVAQWENGSKPISLSAVERVFSPDLFQTQLQEAQWSGKKMMLCLPWYKQVHPMTVWSLMSMWDRSSMGALTRSGDAFVAHARNAIAVDFLKSGVEWSLWIDDDVIPPCGNAGWFQRKTRWNWMPDKFAGVHTVNRLLSHGKSLVGGLYFGRSEEGKPMYAEGANDPREAAFARTAPVNVIKPTRWVATGCLLIHRQVFVDMSKKFPHLDNNWFTSSEHDLRHDVDEILKAGNLPGNEIVGLLRSAMDKTNANSKLGYGEDVQFSIRAAAAGHQPHIDLGVVCAHVGGVAYGPHNTVPR